MKKMLFVAALLIAVGNLQAQTSGTTKSTGTKQQKQMKKNTSDSTQNSNNSMTPHLEGAVPPNLGNENGNSTSPSRVDASKKAPKTGTGNTGTPATREEANPNNSIGNENGNSTSPARSDSSARPNK